MYRSLVVFVVLLGSLLAGCVPEVEDRRPEVTVINGPTEARVGGLARELEHLLREHGGGQTYRFTFAPPVRFQETHRDMYGSRALLQAAFISRVLGSDYALLVGAPTYEREVREVENWFGKNRVVDIRVRLRASIIDPVTAEEVEVITSQTAYARRVESASKPLVPLKEDSDLRRARADALASIAPAVAAELEALMVPLARH
jgi:hypothetical protein